MESISEATRILSLHQVYLQIGKYFVHSFLHPIFVFSLTDFHVHKQKPWSNGLISLGPVNHLLIVSECQWSFSFIFWKLSHIMQLYPYFWFALPYIFFSMIGYCPHASNGHRNLRYLKTLLRLEMLKKKHRFHIAQGSHWIRQIWRILRQSCSDDWGYGGSHFDSRNFR